MEGKQTQATVKLEEATMGRLKRLYRKRARAVKKGLRAGRRRARADKTRMRAEGRRIRADRKLQKSGGCLVAVDVSIAPCGTRAPRAQCRTYGGACRLGGSVRVWPCSLHV